MACATLKRSLELDSLCSRPNKRRRFNPLATPSIPTREEEPSPFAEVTPRLNMDQISVSLRQEMKRRHRRERLFGDREGSSSPNGSSSPSYDISIETLSQSNNQHKQDKHLFTFRQVEMICERLLKEREESLREMYDRLLSQKLSEQYDTFVKFTYDQIQKRFDSSAAPSYLS